MSVNVKKNGALVKLAGLYDNINLRLSQLLDTDISSLEDGQILAYNNETEKWENQEAPAGVEVVDDLVTQSATSALSANQGYVLNNALAGKANTSDVLPKLITNPANKQILSYDSSSSKWVNSVNGNTVLLGTADPAANLGKEGDLYVKLSSPSYGNSYRIHTKSTGGETASIDVDTITDGAVVTTQNINYHWPAQTFPDFSTNYKSGNWSVTITSDNVYGRAKGSTIIWPYYQTNDVTLTINPPSVYGIFVKSRGIWIQIGKSPVENFAELKDTNFNNLQNGQLAVYNSTTGKWENQTPDFSDKFVITFTPTGTDPETHKPTLTADKTPAETAAAINDGKFIVGNINTGDETFHLSMVTSFVGPESTDSVYLVLGSSFYTGYEEEGELRTYTLDLQSSQYTQESTWENISITFGDIENVRPIIKFPIDEDEGVYSIDQDFQEFLDAYYSHQNIFLTCNGQEYAYEKYDSSTHTFYFTSTLADSIKTFVLVGNSSTGEWTSITLEETSINSGADIFTITLTENVDPQTGEVTFTSDKLPSEVIAARNNGSIIRLTIIDEAKYYFDLSIDHITEEETGFIFINVRASSNHQAIFAGFNLIKDANSDTWASIELFNPEFNEPIFIEMEESSGEYSCNVDFNTLDDAYYSSMDMIIAFESEFFRLVKYDTSEDTFYFANTVSDSSGIKTRTFVMIGDSSENEWTSITLTESSVGGSSEFSLEQTATTSTSANTVYTFTDARITANNVVDVYTNIFGVSPSNIVLANGSCTVTFPAQSSAQSMTCKIYVK